MQDVTVEDLNILHDEVGLAVDDNSTGVALLSSRLGVEVGLVEQNTDESLIWCFRSGLVKFAGVVDSLDLRVDISET